MKHKIDIGSYVQQRLFDDVHRYGIVIAVGEGTSNGWVRVAWSPRHNHPVANGPYMESVKIDKLEAVGEKCKQAT